MVEINNESDYARFSERADTLYDAPAGTPQRQELEEILAALKAYEEAFIRMLKENG